MADGCSTDGSLEVLERWLVKDSVRIVSRSDTGLPTPQPSSGRARNSDYWLNADDLYPPGALARSVAAFDVHPEWLMLYGEEFNSITGLQYVTSRCRLRASGFRSTVSSVNRLCCFAAVWESCWTI